MVGNANSVPYAQKVWLYKDFSALLQCLRYRLMAFARFRSLLPYSTVLNRGGGVSSPCRIIKHDPNDIHPLIFLATRYVWSRSCYLSYSPAKRVCTLQRLEREGRCTLQSFAPHERSTAKTDGERKKRKFAARQLPRCESLVLYRIMYGNRAMEVQRTNSFVVGSDNTEIVWGS